MKTSEIRNMSTEDINKKIAELKRDLFDMRLKQATASLEKPHRIRAARKDIARMKTVPTERMIAEETNKGGEK